MAHVNIKHGDWVFVRDGRKALLLRNDGDPDLLDLRRVEALEKDEHAPSREQGTGSTGSGHSDGGMSPTDWHALEEELRCNRRRKAQSCGRARQVPAHRNRRAAEGAWRIAPRIFKEAAGDGA